MASKKFSIPMHFEAIGHNVVIDGAGVATVYFDVEDAAGQRYAYGFSMGQSELRELQLAIGLKLKAAPPRAGGKKASP